MSRKMTKDEIIDRNFQLGKSTVNSKGQTQKELLEAKKIQDVKHNAKLASQTKKQQDSSPFHNKDGSVVPLNSSDTQNVKVESTDSQKPIKDANIDSLKNSMSVEDMEKELEQLGMSKTEISKLKNKTLLGENILLLREIQNLKDTMSVKEMSEELVELGLDKDKADQYKSENELAEALLELRNT